MLEFKNKDVADKYTSAFKGNPVVHKPGGKNKNGFKVKLSDITMEQADRIFEGKNQNLLQLKTQAPSKKFIPEKPKNSETEGSVS